MPHTPTVSFRRLQMDDMPMLHDWLGRPHVAEWWDDAPATLDGVYEEFAPLTEDDSPVLGYIAMVDGAPIGFIQSYVVKGAGGGWWPDEQDPGARGIDQYLADAGSLGRGLGTEMVRAFVARLFADPAVTRVQTDPRPTNARAIRCYEKAGFRPVGVVDTPDGAALLMVCERPAT